MNRNSITNTMDGINYTYRKSPSGDRVTVTRNGNTETFYSNDYVQDMIDKHIQARGDSFSAMKHKFETHIKGMEEILAKVDRVTAVDRDQFSAGLLSWYIQTVVSAKDGRSTIKPDTADSMARMALSAFKENLSLTKIVK